MAIRLIRNEPVPGNYILLTGESASPPGWADDCTLYSKFIKSVPNSCTNPGSSVGSATHTHGATGAHDHGGPASIPHSHSGTSGGAPTLYTANNGAFNSPGASGGHTHPITWNTVCATSTIGSSGCHSHPTSTNECLINRTTVRYMKKDTIIDMRKKQVPHRGIAIWTDPLACIPPCYSQFACLDGQYTKGIASACAATLSASCAGSAAHGAVGHSHPVSVSSHTHPQSVGPLPNQLNCGGSCGVCTAFPSGHGHPVGTSGPGTGSSCSSCAPHSHSHSCQEPKFHTVTFIQRTVINMRRGGIPNDVTGLWSDTLASIPTGFLLNNGCCSTPNMLDRYPKGVASPATCPGPQGGCNTHTHSAPHSHPSVSIPHTHPSAPLGPASAGFTPLHTPAPTKPITGTHSHSAPSSSAYPAPISLPATCHSHPSGDIKPPTIEVAFISRK